MLARLSGRRPIILSGFAVAAIAALTLVPTVGAEVAQTSDTAGSAYATAIAKAKEKRAAKLKNCNKKPTQAKRAACKKAANQAYQTAKDKAQEKRDETPSPGSTGGGGPPSSPVEEYHECLDKGGDPRECKEGTKGAK